MAGWWWVALGPASSAAISLGYARLLPDRVPLHWGVSGQPDRYGAPFELLVTFPAVHAATALVLVGSLLATRVLPKEAWGFVGVVCGFQVLVQVLVLESARGHDLLWLMPAVVGALIAQIGLLLGKLPLRMINVLPPAALLEENADRYRAAVREGGLGFVVAGAGMAVAGLTFGTLGMLVSMAGIPLAIAFLLARIARA